MTNATMSEERNQIIELTEPTDASTAIRREVQDIKEAVDEAVCESCLTGKVEALRDHVDDMTEDVQSWNMPQQDNYIEALEIMKTHVDEIQGEWDNVSTSLKTQRERLESLLESFPGIIETSTLKALSLRVMHLEKLVSTLVGETVAETASARSNKQLVISLVALGITIVLWVVWIILTVVT